LKKADQFGAPEGAAEAEQHESPVPPAQLAAFFNQIAGYPLPLPFLLRLT